MDRRPVVLVDCDGPLADFISAALTIVYEETGKRWLPEQITTWEIFETINDKDLENKVYDKIKSRGGCIGISVMEGARVGLHSLQQIAEVVIVTSPFHGSETWVYERELWLAKHFNIDHHDIIHARKKQHVAGDFLIDDHPKHIKAWGARWPEGQALLWDLPVNRGEDSKGLTRVYSWADVYERVAKHPLLSWEALHGREGRSAESR